MLAPIIQSIFQKILEHIYFLIMMFQNLILAVGTVVNKLYILKCSNVLMNIIQLV